MKTLELIFGITFCWFFIGWLFAVLKTKYWHHFIIDKKYAIKYNKCNDETPWNIYVLISLIWPIQSFDWLLNNEDSTNRLMPITPLGFWKRTTKSNINNAIIENIPVYYSKGEYKHDIISNKIEKEKFIREQFGFGVLVGAFHIIFWLVGVILWVIMLMAFVISQIINWIITWSLKLFYFTYPFKSKKISKSI